MDTTTSAVRDMYEAYPYPSGSAEIRVGFDARYVLSKGRQTGPAGRTIRVLDAGCGRALGLMGAASVQPDVQFLGIDINRKALAEAEQTARRAGLQNARFAEIDLMSMDGLEVPAGKFDVVHSSGVIHHMTDPEAGLQRIVDVMAPHGILVLMVYGRPGRQPIERIARAIDAVVPTDAPMGDRLVAGRALVAALAAADPDGPWAVAAALDDIEFVDRYLHIQETSYTVSELLDLLRRNGLELLQWCQPRQWDHEAQLPPALHELAASLLPDDRYRLVEQIVRPRVLELYACRAENAPRPPVNPALLDETLFAVCPEGTFEICTRSGLSEARVEAIHFHMADGRRFPLSRGPLAIAAMLLRDQTGLFDGGSFVNALNGRGIQPADARGVLYELLRTGVVYRPHPSDVVNLLT